MSSGDNFNSFFNDNKKLAKEYFDTRVEIGRLRLVRMFSKSAGHLIWVIVMLFLFSLLCTFLGLVAGFWFSELTGSYTKGFGLATIGILLFILIIIALRRTLFVNPIIRAIIRKSSEESTKTEEAHLN
jgi:uncharacterized protein YqgC (DUF456 family)